MNELFKTLTFVAVALVLTGAAFVSTRDRAGRTPEFNDQGQAFFPDFKDPLACTDLEVVELRPVDGDGDAVPGDVQGQEVGDPVALRLPGRRADRLSKTAAAVMDLTKDTIRTDKRRRPGGDGRDRPARRQGHDARGARQADHAPRRLREGPRRLHHRQRDQGDRAQGRRRRSVMSACPTRSGPTA